MSFGSGTFGSGGGFGSNNNQSQGFGGFGSSTNNAGGFGSNNATGGFGNNNNNAPGSSLFGGGASTTGGFGASGFGTNANANSPFGAKPAFGGAPASTAGGGMFGSNNTATAGTSFGAGGFGSNNAGASGFGAGTGGMFGAATNKPNTTFGAQPAGGSLFGGSAPATTTGFGSPAPATAGFGGGAFGATAGAVPQNNGTAATPFSAHIEKDQASSTNSHYQTITFQAPYQQFSLEELRVADYNAGRRFGNSNGQAGAFGASTGFGGFGAANNTAAPAAGGFGANNTGTTGGGLFGSNNNNATSSPFGASAAPATTGFGGTGGNSLFGAKPAGGGLFGSAPAASTGTTGGGLFGTANNNNTTNTSTAGFGGFGATNNANANAASSLFGSNNNQQQPPKPTFGGFGGSGSTGFGAGNAASTGAFGQNNNSTGGGLFGGAANNTQQPAAGASLFGASNNQTQQPSGGASLFGGSTGAFGQNNQNQQQPQTGSTGGLFGGAGFGQSNQQTQPKPLFGGSTTGATGGTSLFGGQNNQTQQQNAPSLFGSTNNNQQQSSGGLFGQKPAATGGLFGGGAANTGATGTSGGLFGGGLGQQNNQQQNTGGLFGNNNQQQQKPGGLFGGGLGSSTNNTGGSSLFGGSTNNNAGGNSLFGTSNNQQQGNSLFGNSQQNQQQGQSLSATLLSNPYGNDQLFQNLNNQAAPVGPIATPLAGAQKSAKRPAPLPQFKINPSASLRLITPQKRSTGYGFNYTTYGTPGSAQSFTSNGLGSSLLQSGGLSRSLGKSFSASNLRNTFAPDGDGNSVLAPGAFTPNSRPYAGGSIRRLKIDRNLRTDLFGDAATVSEPSTVVKKRVSFGGEDKGKAPALQSSQSTGALVRTETDEPTTNGATTNGTPPRQETEQVRGNELAKINEDEPAASVEPRKDLPKSQQDQEPGKYWMSPSLEELRNFSREQLKKVHGFTVGRIGTGKIEFDDVDLTNVPLDNILGDIVKLNVRSATVYETEANTPPMGKGLNVPSTITLENSWPRSHGGKIPVHERKGPRFDRHLERLKRVGNTEFISYDAETGIWIFRVQHFTTYGLEDDEDDETEYAMETESQQSPNPKQSADVSHEDEASDMSVEDSNPDDTFDFKKGPSKNLPGGFDGDQSIYDDEDMADETDAQDENSSFLEQRGMSMLEDPFRSSGSGNAAELAVQAEARPIDEDVISEPEQQNTLMPKSILKQSTLFTAGTPKRDLALTGDWAEQLQRTVSPKKQDRHALRERQGSVMDAAPLNKSVFAASTFNTTMDIMNSLWEPSGNVLKRSTGGAKGFEWPYPKRSKTDDTFSNMSEKDRAFHHSVKPSWTADNTLVYAIGGSAPVVSGNMVTATRSIISEGRDVRFVRFAANDAITSSLQLQMDQTRVSEMDGTPTAQAGDDVTFHTLAGSVTQDTPSGKHERALWRLASILFDPVQISCETYIHGLSDHQVSEFEHRIRRDALSEFWAELVREDARTAARDAATAEEKALAFLSGQDLEEACVALVDGNDLRLATIVAQLPGNVSMKEMMKKQIAAWRSQNVLSEMSEPVRALYEIAAGNVCVSEGKVGASEDRASTFTISSRFRLDWRRSFGLRLWYADHETDSLADAVHAYAEDVASGQETVRPSPFFTEQGLNPTWEDANSQAREDSFYGLLKLYSRRPEDVNTSAIIDLLTPASTSGNPLDARLAWQLATLLRSKGIVSPADVPDDTLDNLSLSLAAQLESSKELSAALKALLHLTGSAARETHIRSVLYRRAPALSAAASTDELVAVLTGELKIPASWLWHARALYARSVEENHVAEAMYLLRAGAYDEAHIVLCRIVGPNGVISQDHDSLRELLGDFGALDQNIRIDGWEVGGQVYFDYIHLIDLQGKHGEQQGEQKKRVLERMVRALPGMVAVRHKARVDLEERVAVGIMSGVVKVEVEKVGREEKSGFDKNKLDYLPTAGDEYARKGVALSSEFYSAITA